MAELKADHVRRSEVLAFEQSHSKERSEKRRSERKERDLALLRADVREQYYRDNDYMEYTDSQGHRLWLSPEEYAWRVRRRSRNRVRRRRVVWVPTTRGRVVLFYLGLAALAVITGILLVKQ